MYYLGIKGSRHPLLGFCKSKKKGKGSSPGLNTAGLSATKDNLWCELGKGKAKIPLQQLQLLIPRMESQQQSWKTPLQQRKKISESDHFLAGIWGYFKVTVMNFIKAVMFKLVVNSKVKVLAMEADNIIVKANDVKVVVNPNNIGVKNYLIVLYGEGGGGG